MLIICLILSPLLLSCGDSLKLKEPIRLCSLSLTALTATPQVEGAKNLLRTNAGDNMNLVEALARLSTRPDGHSSDLDENDNNVFHAMRITLILI